MNSNNTSTLVYYIAARNDDGVVCRTTATINTTYYDVIRRSEKKTCAQLFVKPEGMLGNGTYRVPMAKRVYVRLFGISTPLLLY